MTTGEQKWMSLMGQQCKNEKQSLGGEKRGGETGDWIEPEFQKHDHAVENVRR